MSNLVGDFLLDRLCAWGAGGRSTTSGLLPALRAAAPTSVIVADGFSCREQIRQDARVGALHLVPVLEHALVRSRAVKCVVVDPGARDAALRECEPPRVAMPQEVRLRSLEVGLCGTDQDILAFTHGAPPPGRDRWILGYEALLQVVDPAQQGDRRPPLREGDLAVPMVRRPCHRRDCQPCRRGRHLASRNQMNLFE